MRIDESPSPRPDHREASAAVTAAMSLLPYPISKDMAIEAVGSWNVPCGEGKSVLLGRMLEALPVDEFESPARAVQEMDRHWGDVSRMMDPR